MLLELWHMYLEHMTKNVMIELRMKGLLDGQSNSKLKSVSTTFLESERQSDSPNAFIT